MAFLSFDGNLVGQVNSFNDDGAGGTDIEADNFADLDGSGNPYYSATDTILIEIDDADIDANGEFIEGGADGKITVLSIKVNGVELLSSPGSLGPDLPKRAFCVLPQHRILITPTVAENRHSTVGQLVAAKGLLHHHGVRRKNGCKAVEYFHLIFDQHEVIFSEGVATESFYPGPVAVGTLDHAAKSELTSLFPELLRFDREPLEPVRQLVGAGKAKRLFPRTATLATVSRNRDMHSVQLH